MNYPIEHKYKGFTILEVRKSYYNCPALNLFGYTCLARLKKWIKTKDNIRESFKSKKY